MASQREGKKITNFKLYRELLALLLVQQIELIVYQFVNLCPFLYPGPGHHDFSPNCLHQLIHREARMILLKSQSDRDISALKKFQQLSCNSKYKLKSLAGLKSPTHSCPHYMFHLSAPLLTRTQPHCVLDSSNQEPLHQFILLLRSLFPWYVQFVFLLRMR